MLRRWSLTQLYGVILQEGSIFSTYFPGREVPRWFSNRNRGSTVSLTITSSSPHCRCALNLCLVYTVPDNWHWLVDELNWLPGALEVEVCNKSQGRKWVYTPRCYGIPEAGGDMVWLSHLPPGSKFFEEGDELQVLFNLKADGQIKECGAHILCFREDEMGKYFHTIYHSWDSNMFRVVDLEDSWDSNMLALKDSWDSRMCRVVALEEEDEAAAAAREDAEGGGGDEKEVTTYDVMSKEAKDAAGDISSL